MKAPASSLSAILDTLETHYGAPASPFSTSPLDLILWENVAYLADDRRRRAALELLRQRTGLRPERILAASEETLRSVTVHGILPDRFAEKLREVARVALEEFGGDLDEVVRRPLPEAKRALRRFPGIGEPGAEKILLFTRRQPLLAPESNALRVLTRLGICPDRGSYSASYAAARDIAQRGLGSDLDRLFAAHQLLRRHGQELCKRTAPKCGPCPLASRCDFALAHTPRPGPETPGRA